MTNWQFAHPGWFWLMALVPLPWMLERWRPRMIWPSFGGFPPRGRPGWAWLRWLPSALRGLAIAGLAAALARPQTIGGVTRIAAQGVGIVILLDRSSSMKTPDFPAERGTRTISRLDAARATLLQFVEGRTDDLIGLIAFAGLPDVVSAPTTDRTWLIEQAEAIRPARAADDGTNIGDAIALGIRDLVESSPRRKVLVLLTDGHNQPAGAFFKDPEKAAILARDWGITLHTIAIGRPGGPARAGDRQAPRMAEADAEGPNLELLQKLAEITGGTSHVAVDADVLARVFARIDELEKSPVQGRILTRYDEHYAGWAGIALALLVLDRLLAQGRLRRLP